MWGEAVRCGELVGWGDVDAGSVLYVRVQVGTGLDDVNSRWLSDSLGLSALFAKRLTLMSSRASKTGWRTGWAPGLDGCELGWFG